MAVDPEQRFVAVGSVVNEVQIYSIRECSEAEQGAAVSGSQGHAGKADASEEAFAEVLSLFGTIDHDTVQRVSHVCFSHDGGFLAACSTGALSA
jgi:hypothetical protein